jgi:hypothetical protein
MDIWIGGLLTLAGTLIGGATSFVGTVMAGRISAMREVESKRLEERGRLLSIFLESFLTVAEYPVPFVEEAPRAASREMRRAQMALSLTLTKDQQFVDDYIGGMMRASGRFAQDTNRRRGTVEHGGQELIAWHTGRRHDLRPFQFIAYDANQLQVEYFSAWP